MGPSYLLQYTGDWALGMGQAGRKGRQRAEPGTALMPGQMVKAEKYF